MSDLYKAMIAEAIALTEGRAVAPPANLARHEAGHVVVAHHLGLTVRHVALIPSKCSPHAHTCVHADDPYLRAAVKWGGAVADRSLAYGTEDFKDLAIMRAHQYGPAFDLAEQIIAEHGHEVDRIAAALADPAHAGVLFAEDIGRLLSPT